MTTSHGCFSKAEAILAAESTRSQVGLNPARCSSSISRSVSSSESSTVSTLNGSFIYISSLRLHNIDSLIETLGILILLRQPPAVKYLIIERRGWLFIYTWLR